MKKGAKESSSSKDSGSSIAEALSILESNFRDIVTVTGWSRHMGYDDAVTFSNDFRRAFGCRPQPVLLAYRARKAIQLLRKNKLTNYEIARKLNLRNEKGLYQFLKHQTAYAPNTIASLPDETYQSLTERLDKKIM